MKYTKFILLSLSFSVFVACKNNNENDEPATVAVETADDITQDNNKKPTIGEVAFDDPDMAVVFREYIAMKDAMVATNAAQTAAQGSRLMKAFINMGADEKAIQAAQNVMDAGHMDKQREAFVALTAIVEAMLEGEVASGTIYKQYCPMAFNNTGASWLSASSDIMNPYFGDKMLRCGRIEGKIE